MNPVVWRGLVDYANRLHTVLGTGAGQQQVLSPVGAWLLLALAAPSAVGSVRERLELLLGEPVEAASVRAAGLLGRRHPAVATAAAVWTDPGIGPGLAAWLDTLPALVERGRVPGQPEADRWAEVVTGGLIERYPVPVASAALVLATAVACDLTWVRPFVPVPASELGAGSGWASELDGAMCSVPGHDCRIVDTARAGRVGVHAVTGRAGAEDREGLRVVSVIAAPEVAALDVLAAAAEVATALVTGEVLDAVSLWDLPLGEGQAWTVTEQSVRAVRSDLRPETVDARLPAWSAHATHDLLASAETGFPAAADALVGLLPTRPDGYDVQARQAVMARYQTRGFQAAAVTAMAMIPTGAFPRRDATCLARHATLRFGRPYAVVAVADHRSSQRGGDARVGPWHGLPVFTTWVATPEEPDTPPAAQVRPGRVRRRPGSGPDPSSGPGSGSLSGPLRDGAAVGWFSCRRSSCSPSSSRSASGGGDGGGGAACSSRRSRSPAGSRSRSRSCSRSSSPSP